MATEKNRKKHGKIKDGKRRSSTPKLKIPLSFDEAVAGLIAVKPDKKKA
jgi:hypothetical protein